MLVRMKFVSSYGKKNRLTKAELEELEDFLGETVSSSQMKLDEDGEIASLNYRETFSPEIAERDGYALVKSVDMYQINSDDVYLVDFSVFMEKYPNLEVTVSGLPKSVKTSEMDLMQEMSVIAKKIEEATQKFDEQIQFNQKCEVHVPNLGLMNINRMAYATNYCTEELQRLLKQGWRMVAVCPQPNQRRPDYILGKHDTDLDSDVRVQHFYGDGREKDHVEEMMA